MTAPVPHFMAGVTGAGVTGPAVHPPVLAGFAPVIASSPVTAAPLMSNPITLPAPVMPQIVPIAAGGQPLSKLKAVAT